MPFCIVPGTMGILISSPDVNMSYVCNYKQSGGYSESLLQREDAHTQHRDSDTSALKRAGGAGEQTSTKPPVTGAASVTSSHDWCDCIYGAPLTQIFLLVPWSPIRVPAPPPPFHHVSISMATAKQVWKGLKANGSDREASVVMLVEMYCCFYSLCGEESCERDRGGGVGLVPE